MINSWMPITSRKSDEAEKPFWISFSDLMTALMVLFLVVMSIALLSVTQELQNYDERDRERDADIQKILKMLDIAADDFAGIKINKNRFTIDFGPAARFESGKYNFSEEASQLLRGFVPHILNVAHTPEGERWIKRVVAEGFTDTDGSYLFNLDLSLKRAERVVCTLLSDKGNNILTQEQRDQVRDLFLVGGFSFNSSKSSKDESRRVELRIEFRSIDDSPVKPDHQPDNSVINIGNCQI